MVFQAPYLPNLSLCYFFLFPKLKNVLKGRQFGTVENSQNSVADILKAIPIEAFQRCYQDWEQQVRRCIAVQGNYFNGDK